MAWAVAIPAAAEAAAELTASPVIWARTPRRIRRVERHFGKKLAKFAKLFVLFSNPLDDKFKHCDVLLIVTTMTR